MAELSFSADESDHVDLNIGARLGDYRLEQLLERSEAGRVFLARDAAGMIFRLRILAVPSHLEPEARMIYLGLVQKQANQVAELKHTHILALLHYGIYSGLPYLVYPHYPMETLSRYLTQRGPMDALLASRYLDQIAEALEYGHQHGILHRNLSTDRIFVRPDGKLVVADFGVLSMLEQGAYCSAMSLQVVNHNRPKSRSTTTLALPLMQINNDAGASSCAQLIWKESSSCAQSICKEKAKREPLFGMDEASSPAPEQVLGNPVDTSTDVYALGAVLYRMLTGHRVFHGKTREEIAQQHLSAPVPPLSRWRSDLPPAVDNVIAKGMAKDPRQRFIRPGELADTYHQVAAPADQQRKLFVISPVPALAGSASVKPASVAGRSQQARIPRRRALKLLVAGGGAAAAITVVSIFGIRSLQSSNIPTATAGLPTAPAQGSTAAPTAAPRQGRVLARVADIPANSDKQFSLANSNNPGLLIHLPDNRFVAFDSTCTHAGCAVNYNTQDKLLKCPCHGAVFDPGSNAAVVAGPAPSPLTAIPISVNADGTITTAAQ